MMKSNKITPKNGRSIVIDVALDKFSGKVLFEKKVKLAKGILAQSPVPKGLRP
ncbi:MAG TPA: hypothetical protein VK826_05855 [Bacteroidia bacterium]|nr:hypothetical protein [Bacteroidia bacterium]